MAYHPRDSSSQLPLTPPDSGSGYAYANMHYPQEQYPQRHDMGYNYQPFMPPQLAPVAPPYSSAYQQGMYQTAPTTLPSISSYYEPVGAPILPPIRVQDSLQYDGYRVPQYDQTRDTRPAKEDKATGGVSARLDYDMDRMTDFVVSTTQHIFQQNVSSPPAFRKWVHQVLSATRLPSATILLSLHYLSDRLKVFPDSVPSGENQIYRLLSVALILGSKFLDDNTFINRSWSDVTAIKVAELNTLELKWLRMIEYNLHVDASCVQTWSDLWTKFDLERKEQAVRLSPLDTNVNRRHDATTRTRFSPYPTPYSSSTMSNRTFDTSARAQYTPYSAVDPWASNDRSYEDYYKRNGSRYPTLTDIDDANRRATQEQFQSRYPVSYSSYQTLANAPYSAAAAPGYVPWDHYGWNNMHRSDCNCSNCAYRTWRPYGYNIGTVMG